MRQFEIWWAKLPGPAGRRPVLLLSRNDAYRYLSKFIVAEITTTIRAIPVEVKLGRREGLPSPCVANLDNTRTAARAWLDSRAGALASSRHGEVKRALGYALGWDELIDSPLESPRLM
ncbi:MAG TPA: type II toxin-antitoxin system PemK/MazF family toxin [Bryobacteraceae bacterium]|nr:type II toxin-antitoxin system PemK/MazF family toxin [Bryobacteraceae bacterium]